MVVGIPHIEKEHVIWLRVAASRLVGIPKDFVIDIAGVELNNPSLVPVVGRLADDAWQWERFNTAILLEERVRLAWASSDPDTTEDDDPTVVEGRALKSDDKYLYIQLERAALRFPRVRIMKLEFLGPRPAPAPAAVQ